MKEPTAGINREDGLAMSILYKRLDTCMTNMVDALPKSSSEIDGLAYAHKFQLFSKMALDTIPVTKCDKQLYSIATEHWNQLFKLLQAKFNAPPNEKRLAQQEILIMHLVDSDIVKCIDSAGLGWGDFFALNTKGGVIKKYMEVGR